MNDQRRVTVTLTEYQYRVVLQQAREARKMMRDRGHVVNYDWRDVVQGAFSNAMDYMGEQAGWPEFGEVKP